MNAVKVLKQSASDGIEPNTITYSTTIEACARTGHLDVAVEVFEEMLEAGGCACHGVWCVVCGVATTGHQAAGSCRAATVAP